MGEHCVPDAAGRHRRQCARSARVKTASQDTEDTVVEMAKLSTKLTVSLRTTFSHLRRMAHRGQSFQRTGAQGRAAGTLTWAGARIGGEDSSGQNTALTRRGLIISLLS